MADTKISALTALTGANVDAAADVLPIVDTSVTATKKILVSELFTLTGASPQITLGLLNTTSGGIKFFGSTSGNVTLAPTAAAGASVTATLPATTGTLLVSGGDLGTPSAIVLTNATGAPTLTSVSFGGSLLSVCNTGTFTGTYTGYSTIPTTTFSYAVVGNASQACVNLMTPTTVSATSNATTKTITGMPAACRPSANYVVCPLGRVQDSGTGLYRSSICEIDTSGVMTIHATVASGAWTASGIAEINQFSIAYVK